MNITVVFYKATQIKLMLYLFDLRFYPLKVEGRKGFSKRLANRPRLKVGYSRGIHIFKVIKTKNETISENFQRKKKHNHMGFLK